VAGTSSREPSEGVLAEASPIVRAFGILDLAVMRVETLGMILAAVSIAAITFLVCLEILLRSVFGSSTLIASEMSGYLLAASVFLGLAWTLRNGGFIRVDILYLTFPPRLAALADLVICALATAATAVLTYYLFWFVFRNEATWVTSIYVTRTPLWIPQSVLPLGSGLLTISCFVAALRAALTLSGAIRLSTDASHTAEVDSWL
jgi:TRAP-type C4-dicarboxylate transport system permease small subunit